MKGKPFGVAAAALSLSLGVVTAPPANAQTSACVQLLVGAGYAAWMGVRFKGDYHWSPSFPIGQHRCIKLPIEGMSEGDSYGVVVSAVAGSSKVECKPVADPYDPDRGTSLVYNAWGTTFNVHCQMPNAETSAAMESATVSPSEDGLEALQQHMQDGPQGSPE